MSTDGGVIVYGIREDKTAVTFYANPIPLAGVKDRISEIVTVNIQEDVVIEVRPLPLPEDATMGFVVVEVPASIRAPHMVEAKGEYRFYGRAPSGNTKLTEAQIARLYERRRTAERAAEKVLDDAMASAPVEPAPGKRGDLHLVIHLMLSDRNLRNRAMNGQELQALPEAVSAAQAALRFTEQATPTLSEVLRGEQGRPSLDGFTILNLPTDPTGGLLPRYASVPRIP